MEFSHIRMFIENNTSFWWKQHVVLKKTSTRFMETSRRFDENNTSFWWKQHVVLMKTTRRFGENNTSFWWKHHVVLKKTSTRFIVNNPSFWWFCVDFYLPSAEQNSLNFKPRRQNNRKRQKFVYFCAKRFGRMEINFQLCSEGYELPSRALFTIST